MHKKAKFALWLSIFLSTALALAIIVCPTSAGSLGLRASTTPHRAEISLGSTIARATALAATAEIERQRASDAWFEGVQRAIDAELARQAAARAHKQRPSSGSKATGDTWACIRAHESDNAGGYYAVNPNGHYGAYQFSQRTWDATAKRHGRADLVGVRPDEASAEDQDQMARWLQEDSGWNQWSTHAMCGV